MAIVQSQSYVIVQVVCWWNKPIKISCYNNWPRAKINTVRLQMRVSRYLLSLRVVCARYFLTKVPLVAAPLRAHSEAFFRHRHHDK